MTRHAAHAWTRHIRSQAQEPCRLPSSQKVLARLLLPATASLAGRGKNQVSFSGLK